MIRLVNATGDKEITEKFVEKYKTVSSVPTNDTDLDNIHTIIDKSVFSRRNRPWNYTRFDSFLQR